MRGSTRFLLAAAALAAGALVAHYAVRQHRAVGVTLSAPAQNLPAPDFTLPQLNGKDLRLSSYHGKVVLLDFWATWCDPCREEIPHLVELQQRYGDRGLQVIGVSIDDSPDPVHPFYQQFHMNYPVVMGTAQTGTMYGGILGLPITFLITRDGRIYAKHIGATSAEVFEKEIKSLLQN
ncbi:MAG TPA: TlpA disulfide reductase family protein [Candidatus Sulfotelmatobacter sp.]